MSYEDLDNHSQLILYFAGELPEENRERLERALEQDANLRVELEALRDSEMSIQRAMAALDSAWPIPQSQFAAATRQTARAMRQWQVDRSARPTPQPANKIRWRLDWRAYSVAAAVAAVMLFGFTVWWQYTDHDTDVATTPTENVTVAQTDTTALVEQVASTFDQAAMPPSVRDKKMDQVERDVDDLRYLAKISRSSNEDSETQ